MSQAQCMSSAFLLGITLAVSSCSNGEQLQLEEGALTVAWIRAPEAADEEPWFGGSLAVDVLENQLVVGDFIRKEVILLDEFGRFQRFIGSEGYGPGEFILPVDVSFAPGGTINIVPEIPRVLLAFDTAGTYLHRIAADPIGGFGTSLPMAVTDSVIAFTAHPGKFNPSAEEVAHTPIIALWDRGTWRKLGDHSGQLPASLKQKALEYTDLVQRNHWWMFHRGIVARGPEEDQFLFITASNPYEVHMVDLSGKHNSATYYEPGVPVGAVRHTDIPQDTYTEFRSRVPMDFVVDHSSLTGTQNYVTFSQAQRGLYVWKGMLYVYVERIQADNTLEGDVFEVDLTTMKAIARYSVDCQTSMLFGGITESELYIFSFSNPVPGIAAMRLAK